MPRPATPAQSVDWQRYAQVYDLILAYNTAYQGIVDDFKAVISHWQPATDSTLLDVGAGTGNFGLRMAETFTRCQVVLLDRDVTMLEHAQYKAQSMGLPNVRCIQGDVSQVDQLFSSQSIAGVVAVHSLYTLPDPLAALRALRSICQPCARTYFCDLGRLMRLGDWGWYLMREISANHGLAHALITFWRGRAIARENRHIAKQQRSGTYWLHSLDQFNAVIEAAGFRIEQSSQLFRGYSDRVEAIADEELPMPLQSSPR